MPQLYFVLAVLLNVLYSYAYFKKYTFKLSVHKGFKVHIVLFILVSSLPLYNNDFSNEYYNIRALVVLVVNLLLIMLMFKASIITKVYLLLNYYIYIFIGFIFYSAIILNMNQLDINLYNVNLSKYYEVSYMFSYLTIYLIFTYLNRRYERRNMPYILKNKLNLSLMIMVQLFSIINAMLHLLDTSDGVYEQTANLIVIVNTFALYLTYLIIYMLLINVTYYSTYKFSSQVLEGQLNLQIDHYRSFESHMKSIFKFKHDYQKILNSLMIINQENENPMITNIIKSSEEEIQNINTRYKRYSDDYLVDALINHYVAKFKLLDVQTDENLALPIRFQLKEYETVKLFSNILENAIEALSELPKNQRVFNITTKITQDFQSILFENTTKPVEKLFFTKKKDKIKHGYGLKIIEEIIDKNEGFLKIDYEEEKGILFFRIKFTLPIIK